MKRILGLDLGTASCGWAVVDEAEHEHEQSSIIKLGVRVIPLTSDEKANFEKGRTIETNVNRTQKRGMRRNLQRFKLRREALIRVLKEHQWISDQAILTEQGNRSTFETYRLRSRAATEKISLEEFARVLLMLNKKRGYKSNRKSQIKDAGQVIDGMAAARRLYENNITPGQLSLQLLEEGNRHLPDFYPSDLRMEFDKIWNLQRLFSPFWLNDELKEKLAGKNKRATWTLCAEHFKENCHAEITEIKREGKQSEQKRENYEWRVKALSEKLEMEQLIVVFQEINGSICSASSYLGAISDRSKELYFKKQTVGQYLMAQLDMSADASLTNQVFYRRDYLDEFEVLWEQQKNYHSELTPDLKRKIRDVIIFYQRSLKSQKGLISFCEFESKQIEVEVNGKKKMVKSGCRVCPKSSPLFQEFRLWQCLNDMLLIPSVTPPKTKKRKKLKPEEQEEPSLISVWEQLKERRLTVEEMHKLAKELAFVDKLEKKNILKLLFKKEEVQLWDLNFKRIEGHRTTAGFYRFYLYILEEEGIDLTKWDKLSVDDQTALIEEEFKKLGINTGILRYDVAGGDAQPLMQLWHLLYSFEGDNSKEGNQKLIKNLVRKYGFKRHYARKLAGLIFSNDYGVLSAKAMRRILPDMKRGKRYAEACRAVGYHPAINYLITPEEGVSHVLKTHLEMISRNSLRNPVVEKIVNQMVHVVNELINTYGQFDEIRIEMARELKKSARERSEMSKGIDETTKRNEEIKELLQEPPFKLSYVGRSDIIRYKLWEELSVNGYRTLYSNIKISAKKLFTKEFDVEHIIPQSSFYDDGFSNKTLEKRSVNVKKGNRNALDFVRAEYNEEKYRERIEELFKKGAISKTKRKKLLTGEGGEQIPEGFLERDLRNTQYIAKTALSMLQEITHTVTPTTGTITDKLRDDWGLIDILRELNWDKYDKKDQTEKVKRRDGQYIYRIINWTKRNDHRHHAMDALTVAFTKPILVQYFNNDVARSNITLAGIREKYFYKEIDKKGEGWKRKAVAPMPEFRTEAKKQLQNLIVSQSVKNKVATSNINRARGHVQKTLTPRGQLHKETVFGCIRRYETNLELIDSTFDFSKIQTVCSLKYRKALLKRLHDNDNDPIKAFTGLNALEKNPLYLNAIHSVPKKVKTVQFIECYTVRKALSKDLSVDKVVDVKIRKLLQERVRIHGHKEAFTQLDKDPVLFNGKPVRHVTILERYSDAVALHVKKDHNGHIIHDIDEQPIPCDFVQTGSNHHVAIFQDRHGNLQEHIVSFFEATERVRKGMPIIDKHYKRIEGWEFLFTLKANEFFVFPQKGKVNKHTGEVTEEFIPQDVDLMDPENYMLISPHLFRVQKFSSRDYWFRHHLETMVKDANLKLKGITWNRIGTLNHLKEIVKVRVNHIGHIVAVGEYE